MKTMRSKRSDLWRNSVLVLVGLTAAIGSAQQTNPPPSATDNTAELIKQLQQRISDLEEKVKVLQSNQPPASTTNDVNSARRIEELDQKVKIMERNRELDQEAAEQRAKEAPKIILGERGFAFASADGAFELRLKGLLQEDSRTFFSDSITGNDGFYLRRARPIMEATVFKDFDVRFVPDFGGNGGPQIFDAYVNYRLRPELQVQGGKFKTPVGYEFLQHDAVTLFTERGLPSTLVPGRDNGFALHGEIFGDTINYTAGIFNGLGDARNSSNASFQDDKEFAGRLFFQPFKPSSNKALQNLGFGVGGSYQGEQATNTSGLPSTTGGNLPGFYTVGQQQFFAYNPAAGAVFAGGEQWRLSPQASYKYGPFSVLGEYIINDQKLTSTATGTPVSRRLEHTAWQVAAGWVLTGEDASFTDSIEPRRPFSIARGDWGAWQLVARYGELHIDDAAFPNFSNPASSAKAAYEWTAGLNWWLNRNIRVNASYSHTTFTGGGAGGLTTAPGNVTRKDEDVLLTRVQLSF